MELGVIKIQMYISVLLFLFFFFFLPTRQAKNKNPEALLVTTVLDGCASAAVLPAPLSAADSMQSRALFSSPDFRSSFYGAQLFDFKLSKVYNLCKAAVSSCSASL